MDIAELLQLPSLSSDDLESEFAESSELYYDFLVSNLISIHSWHLQYSILVRGHPDWFNSLSLPLIACHFARLASLICPIHTFYSGKLAGVTPLTKRKRQ